MGGKMKLSIYFEQKAWNQTTAVWLVAENERGERLMAKPMPLIFEPFDESKIIEPSLEFTGAIARQFFPALYDALVEAGYAKKQKDESVDAIKYHLEDMRKLVFEGGDKK
jgi:hypothetical protein